MIIGCDRNQLTGSHKKSNEVNHRRMMSMGHELMPLPIPFGDYIQVTPEIAETIKRRGTKLRKMDLINDIKVAVDRKNSIDEICGNLCSKNQLGKWQNVRNKGSKPPCDNIRLMKTMYTMSAKYGITFVLCSPYESAEKIVELLKGGDLG